MMPRIFSQTEPVPYTLCRVYLYNFFQIPIHFTGIFDTCDMHLFIYFYQCLSCIHTQHLKMKKIYVVISCFFFLGYVWHLHDNASFFSLSSLNAPKVIRLVTHPQWVHLLQIFILWCRLLLFSVLLFLHILACEKCLFYQKLKMTIC